VEPLGVIGNISRDVATYPGGRRVEMLGGAALHVALAATSAGLPAAPISVIGTDLDQIATDQRLTGVDLRHVNVVPGESSLFRLTYDASGRLTSTRASFGVAAGLTRHVLSVLGPHHGCHVCCRRPLDATVILSRLTAMCIPFSVDFHLASASVIMPAVRGALPHAKAVFVNAAEFAILAQVMDPRGLGMIVISDGPHTATVLRYGQEVASAVPPAISVTEVTGAGDTLTGTFLAASTQGLACQAALQEAVNAASQAAASPGLSISARGH
jgi:sugar/nucleoside kinase (ribokinase family)